MRDSKRDSPKDQDEKSSIIFIFSFLYKNQYLTDRHLKLTINIGIVFLFLYGLNLLFPFVEVYKIYIEEYRYKKEYEALVLTLDKEKEESLRILDYLGSVIEEKDFYREMTGEYLEKMLELEQRINNLETLANEKADITGSDNSHQ